MDCLKLRMSQPTLNQSGSLSSYRNDSKLSRAVRISCGGGGTKLAWASEALLHRSSSATCGIRRGFIRTSDTREFGMNLTDKSQRKWECREAIEAIVHCSNIVDNFLDIIRKVTHSWV
jgi:hypothetical protein